MLSSRWQAFGLTSPDWTRLQNEMEKAFGRLTHTPLLGLGQWTYPALNMWEEEGQLHVEAELPGLELADLEIYVNNDNQLTIKGQRKQPELKDGAWHRQERGFGSFTRTLELPSNVDPDKVSAEFKHGVLMITLPKKEVVQPRRIEVKAS